MAPRTGVVGAEVSATVAAAAAAGVKRAKDEVEATAGKAVQRSSSMRWGNWSHKAQHGGNAADRRDTNERDRVGT